MGLGQMMMKMSDMVKMTTMNKLDSGWRSEPKYIALQRRFKMVFVFESMIPRIDIKYHGVCAKTNYILRC